MRTVKDGIMSMEKMKNNIKNMLRPLFYKIMHPRILYLRNQSLPLLQKYKDMYRGERCFIIGNGPSLKKEDLEKISNEITFASNRIYVLFDKTYWRPTFYFCQDPTLIRSCKEDIDAIDTSIVKFIKPTGQKRYDIRNAVYFDNNYDYSFKRKKPPFSSDPEVTVYDGLSVTYTAIQFAVYMGFQEIYLLGVDSNYSVSNRVINKNSYADERMYDPEKIGMPPDIEYTFSAYESAREYAESHNIKIYNATRGGKLEIFERTNFDAII